MHTTVPITLAMYLGSVSARRVLHYENAPSHLAIKHLPLKSKEKTFATHAAKKVSMTDGSIKFRAR